MRVFFRKRPRKAHKADGKSSSKPPQITKAFLERLGHFTIIWWAYFTERIDFSRAKHPVVASMSLLPGSLQSHEMDVQNRTHFGTDIRYLLHRNGLTLEVFERIESKVCSTHVPVQNERRLQGRMRPFTQNLTIWRRKIWLYKFLKTELEFKGFMSKPTSKTCSEMYHLNLIESSSSILNAFILRQKLNFVAIHFL